MKTKRIAIVIYFHLVALVSLPGLAQEQDRTLGPLEEIVVTAERREQRLQDVPLSITAFGDEKRDLVGILSIQDMADFAPGVSFNMSSDRPTIRGIGRQSNFFTLDSPVANYIDGVYTSSVQDAQRRPIFIERTEILRGPQGALSGRGSIAGTINTINKRPEEQFSGEFRTFAGNYERYGLEGTITGLIADWLRYRVNVGDYNQDKGYFKNVATGRTEGDQPNNREILDVMFDVDISENLDGFLKLSWVDYAETRRTTASTAPYVAGVQNNPTAYGPSSSTLTPLASWGYFDPSAARLGSLSENPIIVNGELRQYSNDFASSQELDDHHNYTAHLNWHGPAFDVRWIGGHQNYRYTQFTDVDTTDVLQMTLPTGRVVSPGGTNMYMEDRQWYSNELTFTSNSESSLQWIVGLYQSNEDFVQEPATTIYPGYDELNQPWGTVDELLTLLGSGFAVAPAEAPPANPVANRSVFGEIDGETVSRAIFGQLDYQLSDEWKLTLGLRYNEDEKEATESTRYIANGLGNDLGDLLAGGALTAVPSVGGPISLDVTPVPAGGPLPEGVVADHGIDPATGYRVRDLENTWDAVTGSMGIDFTPTDDALIFFRAARGYRPGGFNAGFLYDPPQVDEEIVDSFEIGFKGTLHDRLQLNTSAFYYDFQDNQQPLPTLGRCTDPNDLSSCTNLNSFVNLPESESKGVEVELNWVPMDNLNFLLTYGYLDASVKKGLVDGNGFQNPDDPAAILPNANPYQEIPGQIDANYTFLPRYTQDLSGNSLANSPKHKVAFNGNYTMDLAAGSLTVSANYVWRDEQYSDIFETQVAEVPSYDTVGLRLLWRDAMDRYAVILYGSNLTDEDAADSAGVIRQRTGQATAAAPGAAGQAHYKTLNLSPPRQYGIELQYRFGAGF